MIESLKNEVFFQYYEFLIASNDCLKCTNFIVNTFAFNTTKAFGVQAFNVEIDNFLFWREECGFQKI